MSSIAAVVTAFFFLITIEVMKILTFYIILCTLRKIFFIDSNRKQIPQMI